MQNYLDQLDAEAAEAGVDLRSACAHAGVALTTLQRWRLGKVSPRQATALQISAEIKRLARELDRDAAP